MAVQPYPSVTVTIASASSRSVALMELLPEQEGAFSIALPVDGQILLVQDPPVFDDSYQYGRLFKQFSDSLLPHRSPRFTSLACR